MKFFIISLIFSFEICILIHASTTYIPDELELEYNNTSDNDELDNSNTNTNSDDISISTQFNTEYLSETTEAIEYSKVNAIKYTAKITAMPKVDKIIVDIIPVCVSGFSSDSENNTICNSDSSGSKRKANEIDCVFPFKYKNVWRDKCIKTDRDRYWCSTDKIYNTHFAYCQQDCPLLARNKAPVNKTHTTCINSKPGIKSYYPNHAEIKTILSLHNDARSKVDPPASNMRVVEWDIGLARLAHRWAESGIYAHDPMKSRTLLNNQSVAVGQNGFMSMGLKYDNAFWPRVFNEWYAEEKFFNYGTDMILSDVGHYTQIINAGVVRIGCSVAGYDNILLAYCNYAQAQYDIKYPYENGTSCSLCDQKNCKNNLCYCKKFCQNFGVLDPITCKCKCKPYSTGDECENLVCAKKDRDYGCYKPNDTRMCIYSNTIFNCPHTCDICSYKNITQV